MSDTTLIKTVFFSIPPATVWEYLTDKEKLAKWFHPAENHLEEGKDYALITIADDGAVIRQCWGTVLQMEPPSLLVCSFTVKPMNGVMTTVKWVLEECARGTKLTLEHSGLPSTSEGLDLVKALDAGWDAHFARFRGVSA